MACITGWLGFPALEHFWPILLATVAVFCACLWSNNPYALRPIPPMAWIVWAQCGFPIVIFGTAIAAFDLGSSAASTWVGFGIELVVWAQIAVWAWTVHSFRGFRPFAASFGVVFIHLSLASAPVAVMSVTGNWL